MRASDEKWELIDTILACFYVVVPMFTVMMLTTFGSSNQVGIDQYGKCKWVELAPDFERRSCPAMLPEKYTKVHVMSESEVKELMQ